MRTRFLWALVPLFLVGCEVGPNYKKPHPKMPTTYSYAPATQPAAPSTQPTTRPVNLTRWWRSFNDPILNDLIHRAVMANLDLKVAVARLLQARAQYGVVASGLFPEVDVDGSATRQRTSGSGSVINTGSLGKSTGGSSSGSGSGSQSGGKIPSTFTLPSSTSNLFQIGFDATWEMDIFGGQRRAVESAVADFQAARDGERDVLVSVLAETARNYIEYRALQRRLALTYQDIASEQQSVNVTRARFNAGLTSDLDVARAEAQVKTTSAELPALREQLEASLQTLAVTLGTHAETLRAELEPVHPIPLGPASVPVGLPSDLLRRRPDVRQAERQLASATAQVGVATADLFPQFSLTGSLGLESSKFKSIGNYNSRYWSVGPSVSWPIFSAGRIESNIHVQNALVEQAEANFQKTVLQAVSDVETSLNAFVNERQRRDQLADAVAAQQRALDLADQLYTQGVGEFLDVLDAQRSLFSAQDSLAQSDQSVSSDLVSLYKALGGGWEVKETESSKH
jgi:NodT family efflux transporter outer membrane factor (OMF) lipoprotein